MIDRCFYERSSVFWFRCADMYRSLAASHLKVGAPMSASRCEADRERCENRGVADLARSLGIPVKS